MCTIACSGAPTLGWVPIAVHMAAETHVTDTSLESYNNLSFIPETK